MAVGSPAGFSRTRLLSQIRPAVRFAAQLCAAGSVRPGGGKTQAGSWRGGSLASRPRRRETAPGCVSVPWKSRHTSPCLSPSALFPRPHWHPQPGAGGSHGTWLPGDSTFTDYRLINPMGPALDRSVCAPLHSDQSHFPTRFLLLGINRSKKAAWTDHCPGAFC